MNDAPTPRTDALASRFSVFREGDLAKLWEHARSLELELALLKAKREASVRYGAESLESDSIVASCNCLEKTNDPGFHKPGCKYRLISERNEARQECKRLRDALLKAASLCSWCEGTGQDNDGEAYVNAPCPRCLYIHKALTNK